MVPGREMDVHEHEQGREIPHLERAVPEWRAGTDNQRANGRRGNRHGEGWKIVTDLGWNDGHVGVDSRRKRRTERKCGAWNWRAARVKRCCRDMWWKPAEITGITR